MKKNTSLNFRLKEAAKIMADDLYSTGIIDIKTKRKLYKYCFPSYKKQIELEKSISKIVNRLNKDLELFNSLSEKLFKLLNKKGTKKC